MTISNQEKEWEETNVEGDPDEDEDDDDEEDEEEEDIVDPMNTLREDCTSATCAALQSQYESCNDRVNSRSQTEEDCTEELFDFLHCRDHCVAHSLFKHLK